MAKKPPCKNGRCIDGWLYNGVGGMIFSTNKRCPDCNASKEPVLQPYQQRVIAEKEELCEKITKLIAFLDGDVFRALPEDEQGRLERQLRHMKAYNHVLGERILAFLATEKKT